MTTLSESVEETITADEANARFPELLRRVCEGHSYTITSDGRPVARILGLENQSPSDRDEAKKRLMEHLRSVKPMNAGSWTRDELYER